MLLRILNQEPFEKFKDLLLVLHSKNLFNFHLETVEKTVTILSLNYLSNNFFSFEEFGEKFNKETSLTIISVEELEVLNSINEKYQNELKFPTNFVVFLDMSQSGSKR